MLEHNIPGVIYYPGKNWPDIETVIGADIELPLISYESHTCDISQRDHIHYLNRAVRKEKTLLYAGNLPVFAFGTTKIYNRNDPPQISLGEFLFTELTESSSIPLCQAGRIEVRHLAHGTEWKLMGITILASLMPDGICALISSERHIRLLICVCRQRIATRNSTASWFNEDSPLVRCCVQETGKNVFEISSDDEHYFARALIGFICDNPAAIKSSIIQPDEGKLTVEIELRPSDTPGASCMAIHAIHESFDNPLAIDDVCATYYKVREGQESEAQRLKTLVQNARIKTGDDLFDLGFTHSVLSLDYCHLNQAWLEGGHWWNCFWVNNFQISAAIALGQKERARTALLFFGSIEAGYNATSPTGEMLDSRLKKNGSTARGYDGMPYYLIQLWQYTEYFGDYSVLEQVFENIHRNCLDMIELCDPDNDGLYSWHKHCNAFLYQADHFAVPGAGISPSVMIAWGFEKLGVMLEHIGRKTEAAFYTEKSKVAWNAMLCLWDEEGGYYLSAIDLNNNRCKAHYYTDLVFPALYSDLPVSGKIASLLHLKNSLIVTSETTGLPLMRVGDLKPDLFGNNNIMPVQICEAAIAYFVIGMPETGYGLLQSCALAYSVYTESPGSAPERLNIYGKGEANYMFGNPAAALPYAVIRGLFGISITNNGKTLVFSPAWLAGKRMNINLPYGKFSVHEDRYTISLPGGYNFENLAFSLIVPPFISLNLSSNGQNLDFSQTPLGNRIRISALAAIEQEMILTINGVLADLLEVEECFTSMPVSKKVKKHVNPVGPGLNIDISRLLNAEYATASNCWRGYADYPVFISKDNVLSVRECVYKLNVNTSGAAGLCVLEKGRSREELGYIEPSKFPSSVVIGIGKKISALSLLYSSETDARLTGETIGEIVLEYDDKNQSIPLTSGINFGSIYKNYAQDCVLVPLLTNSDDSVNHYCLACDNKFILHRVRIAISKEDVQMALIAVNVNFLKPYFRYTLC